MDRSAQSLESIRGSLGCLESRRIPRLHAAAQSVESEGARKCQCPTTKRAGQELEGPTTIRGEHEPLVESAEQPLQLRIGQHIGRAATDVLKSGDSASCHRRQEVDLTCEPLEVRFNLLLGLLERGTALTEIAYLRAERDMSVEPVEVSG